MMKKLVCLIAAAIMVFTAAKVSAQSYNWAVGARVGTTMSGFSVKHNFNASNAIEGLLSAPYKNGFIVTALYERNIPVIDNGFNFYYGAGAHTGSYRHDFVLGIDGIVGLEYKFPTVPLVLSIDYKPAFDIVENTHFRMGDFGLGIKIAF